MMKVKLGDVCEIVSGTTPKSNCPEYWNGELNWITPAELNDDIVVVNESQRKITTKAVIDSNLRSFPAGTVLLSSRAPIGKVAIAGKEMYCNQGFKNLICSDFVYNKYLFYFLKSKVTYLNSLGRGATFKEISKTIVENIQINLPKKEEQYKIVHILDKINEIIFLRQQQLKKLDELVKSRFIEMFGEPLKNNKKWKTKKLKLIAPANEFTGDIEANGKMYWLLQLDMIESNTGKVLNKNLVTLDEIGASTIKFSSDNVLYSKLRPYLNKVVLPDEPGFATSEIIPLLPNEELNKIFLAFLLRDNGIVRFLNAHVSGSKMPRVQADIFWNLDIILPTITLQNQFADFVKHTDKSKLEIQKSLDKLEILKKSLMQQYFG